MKRLTLLAVLLLAGCANLEYPLNCVGYTSSGYSAPIFDSRTIGKQTEVKAGGAFQLAWVPKSTFTNITCDK